MLKCEICGCTDFYKASGYTFCMTCQTQSQDIGKEIELELPIENTIRLRKTRIRRIRSEKTEKEFRWTSWELYNFVLIGLTNELIELGISADIKITVLQLWARYLGKLEVAFMSTKKKLIPRLTRRFKKRDAEIIYGKISSQKTDKKWKKTGSSVTDSTTSTCFSKETSLRELNINKKLMITADYDRFVQSQVSSETDVFSTFNQSVHSIQSSAEQFSKNMRIQFNSSAKEEAKRIKKMVKHVPRYKRSKYNQSHITTRYKTGPELITPMKLWAILYLALRIHNQDIHLGDMIRYGREGHLSYYKLDHLIPPEVTLTSNDTSFLSRAMDITHKGMRRVIGRMAKFLGVTKIICPDFLLLINRYCSELNLPEGISLYAGRLITLFPPKMKFDKRSCIPNYEGRAMAFIIVVLKILFSLDGITEYEISNAADKINGAENFDDTLIIEKMTSCKNAASIGYQSLLNGANSVEAVETALWWLECDEFFNCGYGSVLNEIGNIQMDASLIDGFKMVCGSVAAVSDIEHPISLARYVLDNFPNSIIVGEGAKKVAEYAKFNWLSKGNMIAPTAYLSYKLEKTGSDVNLDIENHQFAKVLESKFAINDKNICDMRLFSFREWQKYIECRRAVLVNVHCPTKLKYSPNVPDVNRLYIKFLESIDSKTDREEPEIITHKHLIPREIVHAMKQCITNISYIDLPLNKVNEFFPSLTSHHSYLQQLLDHPLYDLPSILRNSFSSAKIGYMTKPEFIYKLTSSYDMQLDFIDSNLHFIEKTVSLFEQTKMTNMKDLKNNIIVQDFIKEVIEHIEKKEDFIDYLHRKIPCEFKIDIKKRQYYDDIRNTIMDMKTPSSASFNEFIFNEIFPNGELSISNKDDNENKDNDACLKDDIPEETGLLLSKFFKAYDINLSSTEKKAIFKNSNWMRKRKRKLFRNAQGKFVKWNDISFNIENPNKDDYYIEETAIISAENFEIKNIPKTSNILNTNTSTFDVLLKSESEYSAQSEKNRKTHKPAIDNSHFNILNEKLNDNTLRLFRPFKNYWMYHCNFSRVKPKNFELLEKMLPRSFRWLINECASIIESSTEDLYEEVCLVEAYYAYISGTPEIYASNATNVENRGDQTYINAFLRKW